MIYVALLRGINVGGKSKLEMSRLKNIFLGLGFSDVITYINSGNVIFVDNRLGYRLEKVINAAIRREFNLDVPVLIRDYQNIKSLCKNIPVDWKNDIDQKTDVMFLWNDIDNIDILDKVKYNSNIEKVIYCDDALVWNIGRVNVTKGSGVKLIKTDLYKKMTVRNINTVRRLKLLMQKLVI